MLTITPPAHAHRHCASWIIENYGDPRDWTAANVEDGEATVTHYHDGRQYAPTSHAVGLAAVASDY